MATIDLIVLGILKKQPLGAYDLQKLVEYRNISKWVKISTPSIYKKVIQLEEKGYIVSRIEKEGKMKAIVSITLDNEFVIHDIKVIEGEKGLFIAMPSRKAADGEYRDIAHPINSGTRDMIQRVILDKYETTTLEEAQAV